MLCPVAARLLPRGGTGAPPSRLLARFSSETDAGSWPRRAGGLLAMVFRGVRPADVMLVAMVLITRLLADRHGCAESASPFGAFLEVKGVRMSSEPATVTAPPGGQAFGCTVQALRNTMPERARHGSR
jgi:hypothetical protein